VLEKQGAKGMTNEVEEMGKERNEAGFTLLELMVVVEIIAIMAAISLPQLMRQRILTNESAAVQTLHVISGAEVTFNSSRGVYGTFGDLSAPAPGEPPFLEGVWADGVTKNDYIYTMTNVGPVTFTATATPRRPGRSGLRTFTIDETGTISWVMAAP